MPSLCIEDLKIATEGKISLGKMPPLGGLMAPVGRLVPMTSEIRIGDVVVATTGATTNGIGAPSCPNEFFARGAMGVISDQPICPWDGKFSLQVPDLNRAPKRLLTFVRERLQKPVVAVLEDPHRSRLLQSLREFADGGTSDRAKSEKSSGDRAKNATVLWQILGASATAKAIITNVQPNQSDSTLASLCPDIVIATNAICAAEIFRMIDLAAPSGILVLETHETDDWTAKLNRKRLPQAWQLVKSTIATSETVPTTDAEYELKDDSTLCKTIAAIIRQRQKLRDPSVDRRAA